MTRWAASLALLSLPVSATGQVNETFRSWNRPADPYRVGGPVYSVGANEITSFLITTPEGHVLINSGFAETAPIIEANVKKLGFRLEDVKLLLASHAHVDHVGGHAALREKTGAQVLVSDGDADAVRTGGRVSDPGGGGYVWPACAVDRTLRDGEAVTLGGITFTAHVTPGHTKGCTTWTFDVVEGERRLGVAVYGSMTVIPGVRLVGNHSYARIADDFERGFRVLRGMRPDVVLAPHASFYQAEEKAARRREADGNPFVDPGLWNSLVERHEQVFRERLAAQKASPRGAVHTDVPASVDPKARYVLYLHGRILERQPGLAISPEFGAYEYESILEALSARGFEVIAERRTRDVGRGYAKRVAAQIEKLLEGGASRITVLGASKGGWLALEAAAELGRDDVSFVVLAGCGRRTADLGPRLRGRVLSVYDRSDELRPSCETTFAAAPQLGERREVVTRLGLGHGLVYKPRPEWLDALLDWVGR